MARAELVAPLGLSPVDVVVDELVVGSQLEASPTGESGFPGIYLAGNVTNIHAQVMTAAAAGLAAGAAINADLVMADAHQAVHQHHHERIVGEEAWDERYRSRPQAWSGDPNPVLVTEVTDLTPGTALDAGAGEGGDAFWLAARGWKVTGTDISSVALDRAAARAGKLGLNINWVRSDLSLEPAAGTFDLVTAHFLHLPQPSRHSLFSHLADAVAPGGTLLIVGHDPSDTGVLRPHLAEMGWTADEVADSLGAGWVIEVKESRPRQVSDEDGNEITIRDAVLRARRDSHAATGGA
jgi:SAM-dependent methyltransferase